MPKVVFLCKGTRGDVLPLLSIALEIKNKSSVDIVLVCLPRVLDDHLRQLLKKESVDVIHLPEFGIERQKIDGLKSKEEVERDKVEKKEKEEEKEVQKDGCGVEEEKEEGVTEDKEMEEDRRRLSVLRAEVEVSLEASEGANLIVYNLFSLEGHFLAQHLKIPSIAMSPHLQMRPVPASFKVKLLKSYPQLYQRLAENTTGIEVGMSEVDHWMWRMFLDDYGSVCDSLGLPLLPFPLHDTKRSQTLPPSTPLLYGLSPAVIPRQPWWPNSVYLCGFWSVPSYFYPAPHSTVVELLQSLPTPPLYVGYGSMESFLVHVDWTHFLATLQEVLDEHRLCALLQCKKDGPISQTYSQLSQKPDRINVLTEIVSHDWLFPKCLAVLHHGGTGTVASALTSGKPQIITPVMFDQNMWAEQLAWLGVAYQCSTPSKLTAKELYRAVKYVRDQNVDCRISDLKKTMADEDGLKLAVEFMRKALDNNK